MMFTPMPAVSVSDAAAALAGQNLGDGQPGRAVVAVRRIQLYS